LKNVKNFNAPVDEQMAARVRHRCLIPPLALPDSSGNVVNVPGPVLVAGQGIIQKATGPGHANTLHHGTIIETGSLHAPSPAAFTPRTRHHTRVPVGRPGMAVFDLVTDFCRTKLVGVIGSLLRRRDIWAARQRSPTEKNRMAGLGGRKLLDPAWKLAC
jgi:hypothetical protein